MISALREDAAQLAQVLKGLSGTDPVRGPVVAQDFYLILALWRLRCAARRSRIPLLNGLLRRLQTAVFGIELGNGIELGRGVFFVHPVGVVVGGHARVGDRVRFMGSNTVGSARDDGHPVIEDDVLLGAGARVLGPVRIGHGAVIGANAVVLSDIPANSVAVGVPARVVSGSQGEATRPDDTR